MEPFLAEIRMFSGNFAPRGWMLCQGQLLNINKNQALYTIIGTTYGGSDNGEAHFALPDLRGRVPVHVSPTIGLGKKDGSEMSTLTAAQLPAHTHTMISAVVKCNTAKGNSNDPTGNFPAGNLGADCSYIAAAGANEFFAADAIVTTVTPVGGQPFSNMMPYNCVSYMIAIQGIFPPRS